MALVLFHTRRVTEALKRPAALSGEFAFLALTGCVVGALVMMARQVAEPYHPKTVIDLSYGALPKYAMLSLSRGFVAYLLSLVFTLIYGTVAAHHARAEKVMLPALDVLQAIPVLGFLPGLVLAMIHLFPTRELGLEMACIIMVFTGQAWNMTFSFHGSLRAIPPALGEVARLQNLSWWQTFRVLEVPAAMIGLVWNSMMSMAGGWFFLTVNEAFTLGDHDYRLPGIGSYMNEAINQGNTAAMLAAILAMVVMIVVVDQVFWRPIVVWSQRFKLEEQAEANLAESWMLNLLAGSRLLKALRRILARVRRARVPGGWAAGMGSVGKWPRGRSWEGGGRIFRVVVRLAIGAGLLAAAGWGGWGLIQLLGAVPIRDPVHHADWVHVVLALGASFARTTTAVLLGAAWALPVGIWIGLSNKWSQRLQPIIQVVASFPAPMLFPLVTILLLVFNIPFTVGCVALMLLGAQWYILFNVIAGASAIPAELKDVAAVYRVSRVQRWTRLYIPCVFPFLLTGLITAAGGAWNATIVSEFVQMKHTRFSAFGLGSTISLATADGNFPLLAAAVTTMAVFVVVLNRFFWRRLYHLAEDRYSLNFG